MTRKAYLTVQPFSRASRAEKGSETSVRSRSCCMIRLSKSGSAEGSLCAVSSREVSRTFIAETVQATFHNMKLSLVRDAAMTKPATGRAAVTREAAEAKAEQLRKASRRKPYPLSAVAGLNVDAALFRLAHTIREARRNDAETAALNEPRAAWQPECDEKASRRIFTFAPEFRFAAHFSPNSGSCLRGGAHPAVSRRLSGAISPSPRAVASATSKAGWVSRAGPSTASVA